MTRMPRFALLRQPQHEIKEGRFIFKGEQHCKEGKDTGANLPKQNKRGRVPHATQRRPHITYPKEFNS